MYRPAIGERQDASDLFHRRGAQRMGGDTDSGAGKSGDMSAGAFHQASEAVDVVDKAPLSLGGRDAAEAAMGVEARQQGQADAGRTGGGNDAPRHFRRVGVGLSGRVVVEVVEFTQRRE